MSNHLRVLFLASFLLVPLAPVSGCGGGAARTETVTRTEPEPPPPPREVNARGEREASGLFGAAGGTLEIANGFRVEIPAGALDTEVELHLVEGTSANVFHREEGETAVGPIAELTPFVAAASGRTFRVSAPSGRAPEGFDAAEVVLGMEEETRGREFGDVTTTRWQYHRAANGEGRYVAEVAYFGGHRLQFGLSRAE